MRRQQTTRVAEGISIQASAASTWIRVQLGSRLLRFRSKVHTSAVRRSSTPSPCASFERLRSSARNLTAARCIEAAHHGGRQQGLQGAAVTFRKGLYNELIRLPGALQKLAGVEAGVARAQRRDAGKRRRLFRLNRNGASRFQSSGRLRNRRSGFRPSPDLPAQHGVELKEHDRRENGKNDKFQNLQDDTSDFGRGVGPFI